MMIVSRDLVYRLFVDCLSKTAVGDLIVEVTGIGKQPARNVLDLLQKEEILSEFIF